MRWYEQGRPGSRSSRKRRQRSWLQFFLSSRCPEASVKTQERNVSPSSGREGFRFDTHERPQGEVAQFDEEVLPKEEGEDEDDAEQKGGNHICAIEHLWRQRVRTMAVERSVFNAQDDAHLSGAVGPAPKPKVKRVNPAAESRPPSQSTPVGDRMEQRGSQKTHFFKLRKESRLTLVSGGVQLDMRDRPVAENHRDVAESGSKVENLSKERQGKRSADGNETSWRCNAPLAMSPTG